MFDPVVNILVRTSKRPNYFSGCYQSIKNQSYKRIHLIVNYDNQGTFYYVKKYQINKLTNFKHKRRKLFAKIKTIDGYRCRFFPYNLYFNEMYAFCKPGFIIFLDDDDILNGKDAVETIVKSIRSEDEFVLWKVQRIDGTIPSERNFGSRPKPEQISGEGFCFHSKYIPIAHWDAYSMGDFRLAINLWDNIPRKRFIDQVFTKVNRNDIGGFGRRDDLTKEQAEKLNY